MDTFGVIVSLVASIVGWGYQLGIQSSRNNRNERDIRELSQTIAKHLDDPNVHSSSEWRNEIRATLNRVEERLDKVYFRDKFFSNKEQ